MESSRNTEEYENYKLDAERYRILRTFKIDCDALGFVRGQRLEVLDSWLDCRLNKKIKDDNAELIVYAKQLLRLHGIKSESGAVNNYDTCMKFSKAALETPQPEAMKG